ncbi:putative DnaJ domain, Chaperone J-domain superfamily [Helianthus annuus]|nr:putative DnaJ domain, Chaperone J-domain superfamily [Helianthus annuus]
MQSTSRAEAERLLGIAEKLLQSKDLNGSRDFAHLAQETEPLLDGSDQILAVVDVLLAAEKQIHNQPNWYAVLQLDGLQNDDELIKRQYRKLALLLHPDKNKFPFADSAFKLVADAWAVVSDPERKSETTPTATTTETMAIMLEKVEVRRRVSDGGKAGESTASMNSLS